MITKLYIENFRSIEKAEVDLGKITVLTGANNSGKSSVIYGLLILKKIVQDINFNSSTSFRLPFIDLGKYQDVIINNKTEEWLLDADMVLGLEITEPHGICDYKANLKRKEEEATFQINIKKPIVFEKSKKIEAFDVKLDLQMVNAEASWNGVKSFGFRKTNSSSLNGNFPKDIQNKIFSVLNSPELVLKQTDFVPIQRGFSKPYFRVQNTENTNGYSEDSIAASLIYGNTDFVLRLADYLEQIVNRRLFIQKDGNDFRFMVQGDNSPFINDLVNEGLGTNQLVTILAKVLQKDNKFICIDEPEIHLHPSVISKLVGVLVEIAEKEGKQFLISTHSEHFITALLKHTHQKDIKPEDVKVYYLKKEGQKTVFEHQAINDKGQIEGGLVHFYETELEDLSSLFKLTD